MNVQALTSPVIRTVACRLILPTLVMVAVGAVIIHFSSEIEAQNLKKLTEIGVMEHELDDVRARIGEMEQEFAVIRSLQERYDAASAKGFVEQPGRLRAVQLLKELGPKYDLAFLAYDFGPTLDDMVVGREGTEFAMTRTAVALEIKSLTDTQILGFIAEFTGRLKGQIQIEAMSIHRIAEVSDRQLSEIAEGGTPAIFEAKLAIGWNNATVPSSEDDDGDDDDNGHDDDGAHRSALIMPPVLQWQADNAMSDEDVMRIVARDNLMLTGREAAVIDAAVRFAGTDANPDASGLADPSAVADAVVSQPFVLRDFRLDGLLYFSPTSWSLWLNGDHVTPGTVPADLRVNAITPGYVELVWMPDAAQPQDRRIFTLKANQIYLADTGEVLDISAMIPAEPFLVADVSTDDDESGTTVDVDRIARPEELTLSAEQVDRLRELDEALKALE